MAVAAPEQNEFLNSPEYHDEMPLVMAVPELAEDAETRQKAARFIGACAVRQEAHLSSAETSTTISPIESLYGAMHLAAEGDVGARRMVETNVQTDVIERTMKAGHINAVDLRVDEAGRIQQYGQTMESVQANSLRYAAETWQMRERTEAETRNSFRIQDHYDQGTLEDYAFVVFSPAADNMSDSEMKEAGFFTDTMTCMIQVTTAENGRLKTESASVAGAALPGENRHDIAAITSMADKLGYDLDGKSAAEIIDTPLLVHKSLLEHGAVDMVKLYDKTAGGTFFGQNKPPQDYEMYLETCRKREARFAPKVEEITQKLIDQRHRVSDRIEATELLHTLSEASMVEQAIGDTDINPRVFGETAAVHIEHARRQLAMGNTEQVLQAVTQAKRTAQSSSCPAALKKQLFGSSESVEDTQEDSDKDCEFISKKCPECGERNVKTKVTKHRITGSCGCSKSK